MGSYVVKAQAPCKISIGSVTFYIAPILHREYEIVKLAKVPYFNELMHLNDAAIKISAINTSEIHEIEALSKQLEMFAQEEITAPYMT